MSCDAAKRKPAVKKMWDSCCAFTCGEWQINYTSTFFEIIIIIVWSGERCRNFLKCLRVPLLDFNNPAGVVCGSLSTHQLEIKLLFGPESSSEFSFAQSSSSVMGDDEAELVVWLASVCIQKATATALALVEGFNGLDNRTWENRVTGNIIGKDTVK